jgi:hypothetical protein
MTPQRAKTVAAFLLAALLLACGLYHLHVMSRWMAGRSDLLAPWVATSVALSGGDAYAPSTTATIQRMFYGAPLIPGGTEKDKQAFAYPLYNVFLLAPLTWVPWHTARILFVLGALPALTAASLFWLRFTRAAQAWHHRFFYLAFTFCSWPMLVALRHQQLTLLALVLVSLGTFALAKDRTLLSGVGFALATLKPQVALVLLAWLFLRCLRLREWRLPAAFLLTLAALVAAAEWLHHGWLGEWFAAAADYRLYTGGRLSLSILFGNSVGAALTGAIVLFSLVPLWRAMRSSSPQLGIALALLLALTVLLLPTGAAWVYNQTLLLPGCLILFALPPTTATARVTRTLAACCLGLSYALVPLAVLGEQLTGPGTRWDYLPYLNFVLPGFLALALAALLSSPINACEPRLTDVHVVTAPAR